MASKTRFNLGKNVSVVITGPFGEIDLGNVIDFTNKPKYKEATSDVLDGPEIRWSEPNGHDCVLTLDRTGRNIDDLVAAIEAAYWTANGGITLGTASRFVSELDGSTSNHMFTGCDFQFDLGQFKSMSTIPIKISFYARYMLTLS
jgi:hypothetical protein